MNAKPAPERRSCPGCRSQPEPFVAPVIVAEPEPVAIEEPIIEPRKPKKKSPKKPRPVVAVPAPVPIPALDLYDYPFIERIIEERPTPQPAPITVAPAAVEVEPPSEFHEYSFDLPAHDYRDEPTEGEGALAFIVNADEALSRRAEQGSRRHHAVPNYLRPGDHLEPRRA